MAIKPKVEQDKLALYRGEGRMRSELDYLKVDPITYFYNKFKSGPNSQFLRDDMWTEASIRGEQNTLMNILSGIESASKEGKIDNSFLTKYELYENQGYGDYDTYLLALSLPTLDDTTKEPIKDSMGNPIVDPTTGNTLNYTRKEYAELVLTSTFQRYDAEIVEARKESRNKVAQFFIDLGIGAVSTIPNIISGIGNWLNDIYNIGEGLVNLIANWGDDDSAGARFLWAFANDEQDPSIFKQVSDFNQEISYKLAYEYSTAVNAVEAYEHGYIPHEWGEYLGSGWKTEGDKVYQGFGKVWNGVTVSIGYMLPSIMTANIAGAAGLSSTAVKTLGSAAMYTGIASGNIKDTVESAGVSYKQLNAGNVISNAVVKAAAQYAVEVALGKVLGFFSVTDRMRGLGGNTVKNATKIGSTEGKAALIAAGRGLKSMAKEGLEEALQDLSDGLIDTFYSGYSGKLNDMYAERGAGTMSLNNLLQAFIAGALTEGVVGTVSTALWSPRDAEGNKIEFVGERDGEVFKLGKFQSLNFAQALQSMNEWNDTLNNAEISKEEKANVAMKMSTIINTVGDVLGSFGELDAIKANNLLLEQANRQAKHEAINKLSDTEYAKSLYDSFNEAYAKIKDTYDKQQGEKRTTKEDGLLHKVKTAIKNLLPQLKKSDVSEVDNIVTTTMEIDSPNTEIPQDTLGKLKSNLKALGAEVLIGVDGNLVAKSEDIIILPNELLLNGDIATIVQGVAYHQVRESVKTALGPTQRNRVLNTYAKIVGKETNLDEAINALLFDKIFYTKLLLMTEERTKTNKLEAIELLATIDNLIKTKGGSLVQNGTLEKAAYNTLLNKVYETMRTGLIVYATQYARLDLGTINNAILPIDIKDEITKHRNVIFSNQLDPVLNGKVLNDQDLALFDNNVDKFNTQFNAETISLIKKKARSTNRTDRIEAAMMVVIASKATQYRYSDDKVVYLPTSSEGIVESEHIKTLENFFGLTFTELISGNYNANDLTENAKEFICPDYKNLPENIIEESSRYRMSDKDARIACVKDMLFMLSGKTLTVGSDGTLLKVISKEDFLKDEYLGEAGNIQFKRDIISRKITKVKDIAKATVSKKIANVKIEYDPVLTNSHYDETNNIIFMAATSDTFNVVHEVTHATQNATKTGVNSTLGGRRKTFENLPTDTLNKLDKYISTTFPMVYNYLSKLTNEGNNPLGTPDMVYYLLEGEIQANTTLTFHSFDIGFKWRDNKTILVAPTKNEKGEDITFPMKANAKAARAQFRENVADLKSEIMPTIAEEIRAKKTKKNKVAEGQIDMFSDDKPLTEKEKGELAKNKKVQKFIKNSIFKDANNVPKVYYHGGYLTKNMWLSSSPKVSSTYATTYARHDETMIPKGEFVGYVVNASKDEVLTIDGKNSNYYKLPSNDIKQLLNTDKSLSSTDSVVEFIKANKDKFKQYKVIEFKNIKEATTIADSLFILDDKVLLKVSDNDAGEFIKAYTDFINKHPEHKEYTEEYYDEFISDDRVLSTLEEATLMQNPDIKEFTKNSYLKKDGNPIIFYRGSSKGHELTSPSKGLFMSTKEYIGTDYAESKISEKKTPSLKAYVVNFTKDEVLEIDNKGL